MEQGRPPKRIDFSERVIDILNKGALNLALGIGYRTGLFDAMDALASPCAAADIAERAGLDPRYVREWLGVVSAGAVVELVPGEAGENRYFLPPEHAAVLARRAGSDNLGVYTQEVPLLTHCAMAPVIEGFRTGRGVAYGHYPQFQAFMGELADAKHQQVLVGRFLPAVDDGRLVQRLRSGIRVCDIGCGQGLAPILMAEAFPRSRFAGVDSAEKAVARARRHAEERGLENIEFSVVDAARLDRDPALAGAFDYVTAFDAIHDQQDPAGALGSIYHILAPGGLFSMVDIAAHTNPADNLDHPMAPFLYTVSLMHCLPVGLADGGAGLGMMWGREKAVAMLAEAGFSKVAVLEIPDDPFNLHFQSRK
jgi:2-polyprenyl-3-methyl-5-hydroxy-6-metoxy-1,4-benzoquinol methylase